MSVPFMPRAASALAFSTRQIGISHEPDPLAQILPTAIVGPIESGCALNARSVKPVGVSMADGTFPRETVISECRCGSIAVDQADCLGCAVEMDAEWAEGAALEDHYSVWLEWCREDAYMAERRAEIIASSREAAERSVLDRKNDQIDALTKALDDIVKAARLGSPYDLECALANARGTLVLAGGGR